MLLARILSARHTLPLPNAALACFITLCLFCYLFLVYTPSASTHLLKAALCQALPPATPHTMPSSFSDILPHTSQKPAACPCTDMFQASCMLSRSFCSAAPWHPQAPGDQLPHDPQEVPRARAGAASVASQCGSPAAHTWITHQACLPATPQLLLRAQVLVLPPTELPARLCAPPALPPAPHAPPALPQVGRLCFF